MPVSPARRTPAFALTSSVLLFIALGLALIPLAGIEDDEALFTHPLFRPAFFPYTLAIFHHHLPLMVFSYSGALKTYLYWPVFKIFAPGPYSLRFPAVLAGAATVVLFYDFAKSIAGVRAALFSAVLLASDPSFLMSNTFDWGPVALQHLLLVAGCCLIARGALRSGCFLFGLALWDKAVFVWALAGLIAGVIAAYLPELLAALKNKRRVAGAAIAFLIGMSPLIAYNIKSRNETVRSSAHFSFQHFPLKARELELALNGAGLFRFLAAEDWESNPKPPASLRASISAQIHGLAGPARSSLFPWASALALLGAPFWWRSQFRRPALFAIVFSVVAFAFMAATRDAGEAIHHTVLLWPMPQLLVGSVLAAIGFRWLPAALASVLVVSNLLVINQYLYQLDRNGANGGFTDAIYPLSAEIRTIPADNIYVMDWGLTETLTFLGRGTLPLLAAADPFFTPAPDSVHQRMIANMLGDSQGVFAGHVRDREVFTGVSDRLDAAARAAGYQKQVLRIVSDSNAHPVFEVLRFIRQ